MTRPDTAVEKIGSTSLVVVYIVAPRIDIKMARKCLSVVVRANSDEAGETDPMPRMRQLLP